MKEKTSKKQRTLQIFAVAAFLLLLGIVVVLFITAPDVPPESEPVYIAESNSVESEITELPVEQEPQSLPEESEIETSKQIEPLRVSFSAVGDNLIHGSIFIQGAQRAAGTDKEYDFTYLYQDFADFLPQYDVNFINQETLLTDELAPSHYPCFATPGEIGRETYRLGWRVYGTSNNHIYDKGADGISSTLRYWSEMPEDAVTVGLYRDEADYSNIRLHTVNGITIAYLAYTQYTNGIPTPANAEAHIIYTSQTDVIEQQLRQANEEADVVVVSVHWGVEDSHDVSDGQRLLAAQMAGWGADVILGTHPHVIQTIEEIQNEDGSTTLCAYSLGNFVSAQSRPDELIGIALSYELVLDAQDVLSIENIQAHPVVTHYDAGYSNIRVLMLKDYTAEEALKHGARGTYNFFDLEYIKQVISDYIPQQYINWES